MPRCRKLSAYGARSWALKGQPVPSVTLSNNGGVIVLFENNDDEVMRLLNLMLTSSGKRGVPQGGVVSHLLSNIYLTEVDRMLERAKEATRNGKYTYVEYARFADDLAVLIETHPRHAWLLGR